MKSSIKCPYDPLDMQADCFGRHTDFGPSRTCRVLTGEEFTTKNCRFYKPYSVFLQQRKKYGGEK